MMSGKIGRQDGDPAKFWFRTAVGTQKAMRLGGPMCTKNLICGPDARTLVGAAQALQEENRR